MNDLPDHIDLQPKPSNCIKHMKTVFIVVLIESMLCGLMVYHSTPHMPLFSIWWICVLNALPLLLVTAAAVYVTPSCVMPLVSNIQNEKQLVYLMLNRPWQEEFLFRYLLPMHIKAVSAFFIGHLGPWWLDWWTDLLCSILFGAIHLENAKDDRVGWAKQTWTFWVVAGSQSLNAVMLGWVFARACKGSLIGSVVLHFFYNAQLGLICSLVLFLYTTYKEEQQQQPDVVPTKTALRPYRTWDELLEPVGKWRSDWIRTNFNVLKRVPSSHQLTSGDDRYSYSWKPCKYDWTLMESANLVVRSKPQPQPKSKTKPKFIPAKARVLLDPTTLSLPRP